MKIQDLLDRVKEDITAPINEYTIQAGAFGVKRNAELLLKKIKEKGFSPSIKTRVQKSNKHILTVGKFTRTKDGDKILKKLSEKGINASIYKNASNSYSLKVGQFDNLKDTQKAQSNLKLKGFLSRSHKEDDLIKTYKSKSKYPYFSDLVTLDLKKNFKDQDLRSKGLQIFTSLDPLIQTLLEQSMVEGKQELLRKYGSKLDELQGAAIVVDTFSGEIKAAVGNINPTDFGFNRVINAIRPIGSLIKPFVYLTALRQHNKYNLSTIIDDTKLSVPISGSEVWEPSNFDKKYHGFVPLHKALWDSYNIASARLGLELGYDSIQDTFSNLGIEKNLPNYPSVFVGSFEMTPIEAIQAYQPIASGGFFAPLNAVREVKNLEGQMSLSFPYKIEQRFRTEPVYLLQFILKQTFVRGTARGFSDRKIEKWKVGGKTGTSDDQRDSWFVGYAGNYLALIWLGFDDNRKSPLTGRSGALQVWKKLITQLDPYASELRTPSRIEYEWVDINDGLLSDKECRNSFLAPFIRGTQPKVVSEERKKCRVSRKISPSKIISKIREVIDN